MGSSGKALVIVEARGAHFRPDGCGDYQPALYNGVQAVRMYQRLRERYEPEIRLVVDLGLSPEEYSPTGKFIEDRLKKRDRVISDFRERHGIEYGAAPGLDPSKTNTAAYRVISSVRDGNDFDLSPEEVELARGLAGKPYAKMEIAWLKRFFLDDSFLVDTIGLPREEAERFRASSRLAVYPSSNGSTRLYPMERDYLASVIRVMRTFLGNRADAFVDGVEMDMGAINKGISTEMDLMLKLMGLEGNGLKSARRALCFQVPVDGHLTSYFDVKLEGDYLSIRPQDRLGFRGETVRIGLVDFIDTLQRGTKYITSYPFAFAKQLASGKGEGPITYTDSKSGGPKIERDPNLSKVVLIAERADPNKPVWDEMHMAVVSQLETMCGAGEALVISYPTDRIINPDVSGRRRNPREVGREIWEKLRDMEIPGVVVRGTMD